MPGSIPPVIAGGSICLWHWGGLEDSILKSGGSWDGREEVRRKDGPEASATVATWPAVLHREACPPELVTCISRDLPGAQAGGQQPADDLGRSAGAERRPIKQTCGRPPAGGVNYGAAAGRGSGQGEPPERSPGELHKDVTGMRAPARKVARSGGTTRWRPSPGAAFVEPGRSETFFPAMSILH